MTYVPGYGPSTAKLMILGEFPGAEEERLGLPFVGPAGKLLAKILSECGANINEVYCTNVVKVRPPGNDLSKLALIGRTIEEFIPQLRAEISALNPNCILALGNTALETLTGYKGIEKYRGSIYKSNFGPKVVSTLHPASLLHAQPDSKMRSWKDLTFIRWDVTKALKQSLLSEYDPPRRTLRVCRSHHDLYSFLNRNSSKRLVSVDIETFRTIPICIGLAFSSSEAMSIPLFSILSQSNEVGLSRSDMKFVWKDVADLLADPSIQKIGQNFKFDESLLLKCLDNTMNFGFRTNGFFFDTYLAFRTLYPELPGKLEFIASVLTDEPYWKAEGKEYNPKKDKFDRLLLYNAKDAAVTYECYEKELEELQERKLDDFFFTRVMPLHPFYSRIEQRGVLRDNEAQERLSKKYELLEGKLMGELQELLEKLETSFNVCWMTGKKSVKLHNSSIKVSELLYGVLKIPLRKDTGEDTLSALLRNTVKDPDKKKIIELILELRKVGKVCGTYINADTHSDGRLRTACRIMLETGRTSTSVLKPPITTRTLGLAFQTITKHGEVGTDIRSMVIPDKGYVFIEPDLSQAEARVVALLARDEKLLKIFTYGVDIHRITTAWMSSVCPDTSPFFDCTDDAATRIIAKDLNKKLKLLIDEETRQTGKTFRHAGHYDMGKREASVQAKCSEYRAGVILKQFHDTNPNIRGVFHKEIQEFLRDNNRMLTTPFGRQRQFLNRWGDELFKEAYAQIPQSTVSDHLKFAAQRIEKRSPSIKIVMESHDAFMALVPIPEVDNFHRIAREELESPIDFKDCSLKRGQLIIPADFKIGKLNWQEMTKL